MGAPSTRPPAREARVRRLFGAGAAGAGIVTVVFATVGDGVDLPAQGIAGGIIEHGHTGVWALLTAALATAAARGRWQAASGALAGAALVLYVLFIGSVLVSS